MDDYIDVCIRVKELVDAIERWLGVDYWVLLSKHVGLYLDYLLELEEREVSRDE